MDNVCRSLTGSKPRPTVLPTRASDGKLKAGKHSKKNDTSMHGLPRALLTPRHNDRSGSLSPHDLMSSPLLHAALVDDEEEMTQSDIEGEELEEFLHPAATAIIHSSLRGTLKYNFLRKSSSCVKPRHRHASFDSPSPSWSDASSNEKRLVQGSAEHKKGGHVKYNQRNGCITSHATFSTFTKPEANLSQRQHTTESVALKSHPLNREKVQHISITTLSKPSSQATTTLAAQSLL